jgi:hypothetical protein
MNTTPRPSHTELQHAVTIYNQIFLTREPLSADPGRYIEIFDHATITLLAEHANNPGSPIGRTIRELFDATATRDREHVRHLLARLTMLVASPPPAVRAAPIVRSVAPRHTRRR